MTASRPGFFVRGGGAGFEPELLPSASCADSQQETDKPAQNQTVASSAQQDPEQKPAPPEDPSLHFQTPPGCTQVVRPSLPDDLAQVAEAWDRLPQAVRAGIMAMVNASSG